MTASTPKTILALDPATRCGWAHSDGRHGVWDLGVGASEPAKLAALARCIRAESFELLAVEAASFGAGASGQRGVQWSQVVWQNKLRGVVELCAALEGAEVVALHPSSIKAFMCDNGRATKEQVRRAVARLLGVATVDDNDSDAVAILELAKRPDCWPDALRKPPRPKTRPKRGPRRGAKPAGMLFG